MTLKRVNTKVVSDLASGSVEYRESYAYEGLWELATAASIDQPIFWGAGPGSSGPAAGVAGSFAFFDARDLRYTDILRPSDSQQVNWVLIAPAPDSPAWIAYGRMKSAWALDSNPQSPTGHVISDGRDPRFSDLQRPALAGRTFLPVQGDQSGPPPSIAYGRAVGVVQFEPATANVVISDGRDVRFAGLLRAYPNSQLVIFVLPPEPPAPGAPKGRSARLGFCGRHFG